MSEASLRAWERRYGVVVPRRNASGYRLYDDSVGANVPVVTPEDRRAAVEVGSRMANLERGLSVYAGGAASAHLAPVIATLARSFGAAAEELDRLTHEAVI